MSVLRDAFEASPLSQIANHKGTEKKMGGKLEEFTGIFQVSETLSFGLRPVGKTGEVLKNSGLLEQDEKRAEAYTPVKTFLDEQHKAFLQRVLSGVAIDWGPLADMLRAYRKAPDLKQELEKCREKARKDLVREFEADEFYAELVKEATPSKLFKRLIAKGNVPEEVRTFARFACYFKGYQDKILTVTVNSKKKLTFDYHMDGQLASARGNGKSEEFLWDGLALIKRGNARYVNEPYVTGGNPVIAGNDVMFNGSVRYFAHI